MNVAWRRLIKNKQFKPVGWIKSLEVTKGRDGNAHPHFHCLLMVDPNYFKSDYMTLAQWRELWKKCLRLDYDPICHISAVKKGKSPSSLIPELLKYCVKPSSVVYDREFLLELTRQMHKLRAISTGGILKEYLRTLEEEPENLINVNGEEEEDEVEQTKVEHYFYFIWNYRIKRYQYIEYSDLMFDSS